ncbi:MAG TPA: hypothetical protein VFA27_13320 [Vicinamibacterales bacterium]|nr:hypothetical protein [Vicinamibacterales bacterium]
MLGGTLLGSLVGGGGTPGQSATDRAALEEIGGALRDLKKSYEAQQDFHEIAGVRDRLTEYVRSQMKYPDFLDIGTAVWNGVYDWHVRNVQPIVMARDPQGRYTLQFMATTLVLRPDLVPNYIGTPYDNR